jgi:hypothetical protein
MAPRMTAALIRNLNLHLLVRLILFVSKVIVQYDTHNYSNVEQIILSQYFQCSRSLVSFMTDRLNHRRLSAPVWYCANCYATIRLDVRRIPDFLELIKDGDTQTNPGPQINVCHQPNCLNARQLNFRLIPVDSGCLATEDLMEIPRNLDYLCLQFITWNFPVWTFLKPITVMPCPLEFPDICLFASFNVLNQLEFPVALNPSSADRIQSQGVVRRVYRRDELLILKHCNEVVLTPEVRKILDDFRLVRHYRGYRSGRRRRLLHHITSQASQEISIIIGRRARPRISPKLMQLGLTSYKTFESSSNDQNCRNFNVVSVKSSRHFRKRVLRTVPVEDPRLPVLLLTNTCHLTNKLDDSSVVVRDLNPTVVCLTETWLDSSVPDIAIDLNGYCDVRKDRSSDCGGGVAVYVLNEV